MSGERSSLLSALRQIDIHAIEARRVLTNMRVTTDPMRPDEMSDIEQRRVTALGYLDQALDVLDEALRSRTVVRDGRRDI